jgi:hypothetical protein
VFDKVLDVQCRLVLIGQQYESVWYAPGDPFIELNTRYEVLCSIAILLDKPQPTYTYTDAKYAIRKQGKPAGNAGNAG